jgi:excisionase family DNA binding protein
LGAKTTSRGFINGDDVFASYAQISPSQVYTMIQEGALPAVRFGAVWRIRWEDLLKFIEVNLTNSSLNLA